MCLGPCLSALYHPFFVYLGSTAEPLIDVRHVDIKKVFPGSNPLSGAYHLRISARDIFLTCTSSYNIYNLQPWVLPKRHRYGTPSHPIGKSAKSKQGQLLPKPHRRIIHGPEAAPLAPRHQMSHQTFRHRTKKPKSQQSKSAPLKN